MVIIVTFGGDPIAKSPFTVGVAAPLNLSKIEVDGLESSEFSCFWHTHVALWCFNKLFTGRPVVSFYTKCCVPLCNFHYVSCA